MGEVQRVKAAEAIVEDPWAWAAEVPAPEPEEAAPPRRTPEEAKAHAISLVDEGVEAETAAQAMSSFLSGAIQHMTETLDPSLLVEAVASIQRAKAELGMVESSIARALGRLGREMPTLTEGTTATGDTYLVRGGATRKAWDHDSWKHDVRAAIVEGLDLPASTMILDPETGETMDLDVRKTIQEVISMAQSVHGSAAPKVTALKPLGLKAGDYCETYPGPFTITITPTSTEDTND